MKNKFKVGDKVKAFGLNGVVTHISECSAYPVYVTYVGGTTEDFTSDGKLFNYHATPSLKHRKFKPSAKLREFWLEPTSDASRGFIVWGSNPYCPSVIHVREVRKK